MTNRTTTPQGSLHALRDFFATGRNAKGGFMGRDECPENATYRNLSLQSEDELLMLRASAEKFIACVNDSLMERQS